MNASSIQLKEISKREIPDVILTTTLYVYVAALVRECYDEGYGTVGKMSGSSFSWIEGTLMSYEHQLIKNLNLLKYMPT